MVSPASQNRFSPLNQVAAIKQRLASVRASLFQACRELDSQINGLDQLCDALTPERPAATAQPTLFEMPPATFPGTASANAQPILASSLVLKATTPAALDPELEQATLEELNAALSQAFAHISSQATW